MYEFTDCTASNVNSCEGSIGNAVEIIDWGVFLSLYSSIL